MKFNKIGETDIFKLRDLAHLPQIIGLVRRRVAFERRDGDEQVGHELTVVLILEANAISTAVARFSSDRAVKLLQPTPQA